MVPGQLLFAQQGAFHPAEVMIQIHPFLLDCYTLGSAITIDNDNTPGNTEKMQRDMTSVGLGQARPSYRLAFTIAVNL